MSAVVKDRTKSWLGRTIERQLASLNDQFIFFLFLEYQFFDQLQGPITDDRFTTEVFKQNRYASKIHIRLRDFTSFRRAHRRASFGAYFTNSYEVAASFPERALRVLMAKSRTSLTLPDREDEGPEDFYQRALHSWRYSRPEAKLIDTLSFMRHRRNSLIHLDRTPDLSYARLTRRSGASLNAFWTRARVQIDFRIPSTSPLNERETLDLLKLLRIVIQRLDTHFVSVIDVLGLVRVEAHRLFGQEKVRMNSIVAVQRMQMLGREIIQDYGVSPPEADLLAAVQAVGTR